MSRWISKHAQYALGIYNETAEDRRRDDGTWERVITRPALIAQFRPIASAKAEDSHEAASQHDIEVAHKAFLSKRRMDGTPAVIRAIPSLNAGAMGGIATVAFNVDSVWGVFDTDWLGNEEDAEKADAKLRDPRWGGIDVDYVEVVPPVREAPWPNYDKLRGKQGAGGKVADQIAKKVAEDGYDAAAVLEYEKASKNRADVVAALEALVEAGVPAEQDDDAMEVEV